MSDEGDRVPTDESGATAAAGSTTASGSTDPGSTADTGSTATAPSMPMRMLLSTIRRSFTSVDHADTDTVQEWLEQDKAQDATSPRKTALVLLDIRAEDEYNVSHIPGATRASTDLSDLQQTHDTLAEKYAGYDEVKVACYCSLGYRSSKYADALQNYVKTNTDSPLGGALRTYNIEGSLFKWANEERDLVDASQQKTVYAHPYNAIWGKLLRQDLRRTTTDDPSNTGQ